jgi:hypothetical protein
LIRIKVAPRTGLLSTLGSGVGCRYQRRSTMKRSLWIAFSAVAALGASQTVGAADLKNLSGQSCGAGTGTWHFVNNQTGGAADGVITANFTSGQCIIGPSKNTGSTQHFFCVGFSGALLGASTGALPGNLVLSDFSCTSAPPPPPPPPPCDPKTDPNCKP